MKNVKKIRQLTMRLKMQWKILIGVLVAGVACGGVLIFANADSSVSLSLTPAQSSVIQGSTSTVIHANLSGTDDEFYDASNPSNNGIASPVRLEWTISDEDYDVVKFVKREIRRGHKYDVIIMDPPSYGRGANKEVWNIETDLYPLINLCMELLSDKPLFFLINSYTAGLSPMVLDNILKIVFKDYTGKIDCGEIGLPIKENNLVLPCGIYGRWSDE